MSCSRESALAISQNAISGVLTYKPSSIRMNDRG